MATEAGPDERKAALIATIAGMLSADDKITQLDAIEDACRLVTVTEEIAEEIVAAGGYEAWCPKQVNERHRGPAV